MPSLDTGKVARSGCTPLTCSPRHSHRVDIASAFVSFVHRALSGLPRRTPYLLRLASQNSKDDYVQALITYVCSPVLESNGGGASDDGDPDDPRSSSSTSTDAGYEITLKRFGLQILQAVIERAPPVSEGEESLTGRWQPGWGRRWTWGARDGQHGTGIDEDATRLERVRLEVVHDKVTSFIFERFELFVCWLARRCWRWDWFQL